MIAALACVATCSPLTPALSPEGRGSCVARVASGGVAVHRRNRSPLPLGGRDREGGRDGRGGRRRRPSGQPTRPATQPERIPT